jgi:hypothetical protein
MSAAFTAQKDSIKQEPEVPIEKLYAQIGKLKVELDFLKKSARNVGCQRTNGSHQNKEECHFLAPSMPAALRADKAIFF